MTMLIVDASVAAKWLVKEEFSEAALNLLSPGNQLGAPDFLLLEMDSIIGKWVRRRAIGPGEGSELRNAFHRYPIQYTSFVPLLDSAFAISIDTGQSIYDCLYVALATLLNHSMVTADRRLYDSLKGNVFGHHVGWIEDLAL